MNESIDSQKPVPLNAKIFEALSKAQGEFPVIPKDSEVEVKKDGKLLYSYMYADLTAIISATRPALAKHGLGFTQDYVKTEIGFGFITTLHHCSGELLKLGFVPCTISGADMKFVAAQYTYGKRISLTAALGVSADEDLDAAGVEGEEGNSTNKKESPKITPRPKSEQPQKSESDPAAFSELDQKLMEEEAKQADLIHYLLEIVEIRGVPKTDMPAIIEKIVGRKAKSSDLSVAELESVISHIKEHFQR